ncbi:PadR family transcriptional regulator [Calidithermus timidus]|jgi:DNA-binding PadR family transcriptional regulator|uniref:PadR family transcriptional regulator n=1 Tax=Calidithermus timidus TaxID=307124 RepID=UPI0005953CA9|nr:PadR family transcriptional regulator [Calidithermus timidus]
MDQRRLLLLGLLRLRRMHGYQLGEIVDRDLSYLADFKRPTAYHLLRQLLREGLVQEQRERQGERPERRVYSVTPAGEQEFLRLLQLQLSSYQAGYSPGAAGLMFLEALEPSQAARCLRQQLEELEGKLTLLRQAAPTHGHERGGYALGLVLARMEAEHRYLLGVLQELEKGV